nr:developmentally-regulated G-protein 2 [Ipomoea batatas]
MGLEPTAAAVSCHRKSPDEEENPALCSAAAEKHREPSPPRQAANTSERRGGKLPELRNHCCFTELLDGRGSRLLPHSTQSTRRRSPTSATTAASQDRGRDEVRRCLACRRRPRQAREARGVRRRIWDCRSSAVAFFFTAKTPVSPFSSKAVRSHAVTPPRRVATSLVRHVYPESPPATLTRRLAALSSSTPDLLPTPLPPPPRLRRAATITAIVVNSQSCRRRHCFRSAADAIAHRTIPLTHVDEKLCYQILHEYKIHNAEVLFREDATVDGLIDVIEGNCKYMKCVYVYNKIDVIAKLCRKKN